MSAAFERWVSDESGFCEDTANRLIDMAECNEWLARAIARAEAGAFSFAEAAVVGLLDRK